MQELTIQGTTGSSRVLLGESIDRLGAYCPAARRVIVTDTTVRRHHGARLADCEVIAIPPGEATKTLATVESLYERFCALELTRSDYVVGVGGGVVTDITGFAAATYLRGLPFGFVPTTLLAQVDAAIGGKNGVDWRGYKNLVGTIRQPRFCLCDFSLLATLPPAEVRHGFAEVIKAGAIGDAALFTRLEQEGAALVTPDAWARAARNDDTGIAPMIRDAVRVKARIVAADEQETDRRRLLNFGHTVGHAIETVAQIPHGDAVSLGMIAAAELSVTKAGLRRSDADRLARCLAAVGLPTNGRHLRLQPAALIDAIRKDKKRYGERIIMALLTAIGTARCIEVTLDDVAAHLATVC